MYKTAQERELNNLLFMAKIHGCEVKEPVKPVKEAIQKGDEEQAFMFRDPKEYEGMSQEERAKLTLRMMSHYKGWAEKGQLRGKDHGK